MLIYLIELLEKVVLRGQTFRTTNM